MRRRPRRREALRPENSNDPSSKTQPRSQPRARTTTTLPRMDAADRSASEFRLRVRNALQRGSLDDAPRARTDAEFRAELEELTIHNDAIRGALGFGSQAEKAATRSEGTGGEPQMSDVTSGTSERSTQRAAVDAYIAEVLHLKDVRLTRTMIWKSAGYKTRTEFERWERNDPKTTKTATARFAKLLLEKPHLK